MSVFRVKLQNANQGRLDINPSTHPLAAGSSATYGNVGTPFTTSKQRQVHATGPRGTYRTLIDGETFTDCNYWQRFEYPNVALEFAFIETITDDGSVYSDIAEENTFGVGGSYTLATSYNDDNTIDFVNDHGGPARFLQVQNTDGSIKITGELNGDTNLTFQVPTNSTQIFNTGDLAITQLRLKSASGTPVALVLASVRSVPQS